METATFEVRARLAAETAQFTRGMEQASKSVDALSKRSSALRGALTGVGIAAGVATSALVVFGVKAFGAASRVEELDYAMDAVGKSTGLGYQAIQDAAIATKKMGIEMEVAQKAAIKFAQNNLDLAYTSQLARAAQDFAVISGRNSTEVFNMLTHAVITGRSEVLKSVGINKSAGQMYEEFARSIGKTASALTYQEKQQAAVTGVMKEHANIAGVYEAAMDSPGKVLRSFERLHNEIQVSMGNVLLKAFGPMIKAAYNFEKAISAAFEESKIFQVVLEALTMVFVKLTTPVTNLFKKLENLIIGFTTAGRTADEAREKAQKIIPTAKELATKLEMIIPPLAAVSTGLAALGGKAVLGKLPLIGQFFSKLAVGPVVFVALALTSTQVRNALGNLLSAFKPLLPVFVQLAKFANQASVVGVAVLAKAINILASVVRGIIGFIQRNINAFMTLGKILGLVVIGYGAYRAAIILAGAATAAKVIILGALSKALAAAKTAMAIFNATVALNPIPLIIAAIVALIVAFGYLMTTNESFAKVVKTVFNFVVKTIVQFAAIHVRIIGEIIGAFASIIRVYRYFAEVVAKVFEFVIDVIITFQQFTLKAVKFVIDAFISLMESHGILFNVVKAVFNAIIKVITLVVNGILNTLAFVITGIIRLVSGFNFLLKGAKDIFFAVLEVISKVGKGIFGIFEKIAVGIGKFLGSSFDALTGWVRGLANLLGFIPGVSEKVNSALDSVRKGIVALPSKIVGLGQDAFDGIIKGAKKAIDGVVGIGAGVEKGLTKARDFLKDFSAKVKEFGKQDNGAKIIEVMVKGAKLASGALETMIDKMQDVKDFDVARTVGSFVTGIADKTEQASVFLVGLSATMLEFAENTDFAALAGEKIGGFIDKIKESLKEGLGFGDILKAEEKKYSDASNKDDGGANAVEDALKAADRMKAIREAMQAGIESIRDVLDDLKKASKDFADSLRDTILSFGGLKSVELPDGFIPKAKSLIENMRMRLDKTERFAQQIAQLQTMGLDTAALKDIIESGPIKGAQLAASIIAGGAEAVAEIGALQRALSFQGAAIGQFGGQAAFGDLISQAKTDLRNISDFELATRTSGTRQFIEQGAFQVVVNTSGAANTEEEIKMITDKIQETFAILAKELAAK